MYIYNQTTTATAARSELTPPTVQDVFDTWGVLMVTKYYASKNTSIGNALTREFKTGPDRVVMPLNVEPPNGGAIKSVTKAC